MHWPATLIVITGLLAGCAERPTFDEADMGGRAGTAIVLDGRSGAVRSMVHSDIAAERVFIAGNALRLATLLVALEKEIVDPAGSFRCPGEENHPGGPLGLRDALTLPCRSVFREMQRKIPWKEMTVYLRSFGLGSPSGLGGPDEATGDLPALQDGDGAWDLWGNTAIRITPLQLVHLFRRLVDRDLPLHRETMERALQLLGCEESGESARISGFYRESLFSYAWSMAELGRGNDRVIVLIFLLGNSDGVDVEEATAILDRWWKTRGGDS